MLNCLSLIKFAMDILIIKYLMKKISQKISFQKYLQKCFKVKLKFK